MKNLSIAALVTALLFAAPPVYADPGYAAKHAVDGAGHAIVRTGRATGDALANGGREVGHATVVTGRDTVHGMRHVLHIHRHRIYRRRHHHPY